MLLDFSPMKYHELQELAEFTKSKGWHWTIASGTDAEFRMAVRQFIEEKGPTKAVGYGSLNEEVLPDGSSRGLLIDQLRLKVKMCAPTQSLMVIDPYLFSTAVDPTYEDDLVALLESATDTVGSLTLVSKAARNQALESSVLTRLGVSRSSVMITNKYSSVFHDRFWIADEQRGVFVGTSLNGLGKRYALLDYLDDNDAKNIAARANLLT